MDFAQVVDKVKHERLLAIIIHYGITGQIKSGPGASYPTLSRQWYWKMLMGNDPSPST